MHDNDGWSHDQENTEGGGPHGTDSPSIRRATDSAWKPFLFGLLGAFFFLGFLWGLESLARLPNPVSDIFLHRKWTPFAATFLASWAMAILIDKLLRLHRQRNLLRQTFVPKGVAIRDPIAFRSILSNIAIISSQYGDSILGPRIARGLERYSVTGQIGDVEALFKTESQADQDHLDDGYTLVRTFAWAIPILGFIGTVIGVSEAVGGFAGFMDAADSIDIIKDALTQVTSGLATAFDTTFIALTLSLIVMLAMSSIEKAELGRLRQFDLYCQDEVLPILLSYDSGKHAATTASRHGTALGGDRGYAGMQYPGQFVDGKVAEALREHGEALARYLGTLGEKGRDLAELTEERERAEREFMASPTSRKLDQFLEDLQRTLGDLTPAVRKLTDKPISVDVHLLAGHVAARGTPAASPEPPAVPDGPATPVDNA